MTSHRDPLGVAIAIVTLVLLLVMVGFVVEFVLIGREIGHRTGDVLDQLHSTLTASGPTAQVETAVK